MYGRPQFPLYLFDVVRLLLARVVRMLQEAQLQQSTSCSKKACSPIRTELSTLSPTQRRSAFHEKSRDSPLRISHDHFAGISREMFDFITWIKLCDLHFTVKIGKLC